MEHRRFSQPSARRVMFHGVRWVSPEPIQRVAIDFGSFLSPLQASPQSAWQSRLYAVSRWSCGPLGADIDAETLWDPFIERFASAFPDDPRLTFSELLSLLGHEGSVPGPVSMTGQRDPDVIDTDLLAHSWSSVVAAQAPLTKPRVVPFPAPPTSAELEDLFRRNVDLIGSSNSSSPDPVACAIATHRQLSNLNDRLHDRCSEVLGKLNDGDELVSLLAAESVLHAFGFPATAIDLTRDGRLVVAVEWARAGDLVPEHEVTKRRRRADVTERDLQSRLDDLARELVRYLVSIARVSLSGAPVARSVEVLALAPGSTEVVARFEIDKEQFGGIDNWERPWLNDWIQIVDDVHEVGEVSRRQLNRFIKAHGDHLGQGDAVIMSELGPQISIGKRGPDGELMPFGSLVSLHASARHIRTEPSPSLKAAAPLYGVAFWLDIERRAAAIAKARADEAERQRAPRPASPSAARASRSQLATPAVRPRLSTRTNPNEGNP